VTDSERPAPAGAAPPSGAAAAANGSQATAAAAGDANPAPGPAVGSGATAAAAGDGNPAPGPAAVGVAAVAGSPGTPGLPPARRLWIPLAVAGAMLVVAVIVGVSVGPTALTPAAIADALIAKLPWHPAVTVPAVDVAIVWQIRLPRVVLGALVGAMLSGGGAAYQGVFRNPLADPYLLGIAAGAGLAATIAVVAGAPSTLIPPLAFIGGVAAVALTYVLGSGAGRDRESPGLVGTTTSVVLAGVAVAALLTAFQTYLLQQHTQVLQQVYSWILGELSLASWSNVTTILPYVTVSAVVLIAHRRLLDVLRLGEAEATTLGVNVARLRLTVVLAATLGTAAAVSVSGLIGFVGIIVPHTIRLTAGSSYRMLLPVSMVAGGAFLVLADLVARTAQAPAEVPIGVITAAAGAPFFLFVLRSRRSLRDLA